MNIDNICSETENWLRSIRSFKTEFGLLKFNLASIRAEHEYTLVRIINKINRILENTKISELSELEKSLQDTRNFLDGNRLARFDPYEQNINSAIKKIRNAVASNALTISNTSSGNTSKTSRQEEKWSSTAPMSVYNLPSWLGGQSPFDSEESESAKEAEETTALLPTEMESSPPTTSPPQSPTAVIETDAESEQKYVDSTCVQTTSASPEIVIPYEAATFSPDLTLLSESVVATDETQAESTPQTTFAHTEHPVQTVALSELISALFTSGTQDLVLAQCVKSLPPHSIALRLSLTKMIKDPSLQQSILKELQEERFPTTKESFEKTRSELYAQLLAFRNEIKRHYEEMDAQAKKSKDAYSGEKDANAWILRQLQAPIAADVSTKLALPPDESIKDFDFLKRDLEFRGVDVSYTAEEWDKMQQEIDEFLKEAEYGYLKALKVFRRTPQIGSGNEIARMKFYKFYFKNNLPYLVDKQAFDKIFYLLKETSGIVYAVKFIMRSTIASIAIQSDDFAEELIKFFQPLFTEFQVKEFHGLIKASMKNDLKGRFKPFRDSWQALKLSLENLSGEDKEMCQEYLDDFKDILCAQETETIR